MKKIGFVILVILLAGCTTNRTNVSQPLSGSEQTVHQKQDDSLMDEGLVNKDVILQIDEGITIEEESEGKQEETQGVKQIGDSQQVERIEAYLERMSIEEKIGQLFMVAFRKGENGDPITVVNEKIREVLNSYHVGGIILFSENIETREQTKKFIQDLQMASNKPLWIAVDEEGGLVSRIGKNKAINEIPFKEAFAIGQTKDVQVAYKEARRMGQLLKEIGFNLDFAPVADIYNEPSNTVIGYRSFGTNQEEVVPMVLAFSKGLKEEGIQPVVKHFPGHGNTVEDSHEGIAYVNKKLNDLEEEELLPFKVAIEEGVGAIMKGHLMVPDVDDKNIVSLSRKWKAYMESQYDLSETLVITDAMDMGAVIQNYGSSEAAVLSVLAGNDLLLMPYDLKKAYEGVLKAYEEGRITKARIDESVRKILSKKVAHNILVLA